MVWRLQMWRAGVTIQTQGIIFRCVFQGHIRKKRVILLGRPWWKPGQYVLVATKLTNTTKQLVMVLIPKGGDFSWNKFVEVLNIFLPSLSTNKSKKQPLFTTTLMASGMEQGWLFLNKTPNLICPNYTRRTSFRYIQDQ